jgi:hypothetical protein
MKFSELIAIMSEHGVHSLAEIARKLEVSPQSVSNWKARDQVPYKYVVEVQNRFDLSSNGKPTEQNEFEPQVAPISTDINMNQMPPFMVEKEKTFHLSEILAPIADNVDTIIKSTVVCFFFGLFIYLMVILLPEKKMLDIDLVYTTTAKLIVPGSGGFAQAGEAQPGGGGVIGQLLGLTGGGGNAGSGAASLTSPAIWPEFLNSHAFAKRMLNTKYRTEKYEEEKSLLEMAILIPRERGSKNNLWEKYFSNSDFDPGDWIELYNIGTNPVNLKSWSIVDETSGNTFSFANNYILSGQEYVVVCYDTTKFKKHFPQVKNYLGNLNIGLDEEGEHLSLYSANENIVDSLTYEDSLPWPIETDGTGRSLELVNPSLNNADPKNWSASNYHGSPGQLNHSYDRNEISTSVSGILINEINYNSTFDFDTEMPDEGLDTLIMQNIGVLSTMIQFGSSGSFQTLTVSSFEPKLAVNIAYVVLDELKEFSNHFQNRNLQEKRKYIEERIEVIGKELDDAREEYRVFTETNRTVSSLRLQWELQKVEQQVNHYQGIYTGLITQLENVKIEQSDNSESEPLIVDYPIPPLGPNPIEASTLRSPKFVLLITLAGLGFGFVMALAKGYFSIVEQDEKRRLKVVKEKATLNIKKLVSSIRIRFPFRKKSSFRD